MGEVRELNLTTVLRLIHQQKVCSRADLAQNTGLQQSTITNITNLLIDCGIVTETGIIEGRKGRRSIGITLAKDKYQVVGARLSRDNYSVERFFIDGTHDAVVSHNFEPNPDIMDVLEAICRDVQRMIDTAGLPIAAIGFSVPGPFKVHEGRFMNITYMNGMEKISLRDFFEDRFAAPIYIEHDANAGILAEKWFGLNHLEKGTYVYIAAGTGVGAGVMIDGRVFHGRIGIAGEIGHMSINCNGPRCACGNVGCLELYSSAHAISETVRKQARERQRQTSAASFAFGDILEAYRQGDALATEAILESADYMARGIVNIMNVLNPDGIIIGDLVSKAGTPYFERIRQTAARYISKDVFDTTAFYLSSFSQDAALVGAGALAIDNAFRRPMQLIDLVRQNGG